VTKVKPLLDGWYQSKAKAIFAERLAVVMPQANWVNSSPILQITINKKTMGQLLNSSQPSSQSASD